MVVNNLKMNHIHEGENIDYQGGKVYNRLDGAIDSKDRKVRRFKKYSSILDVETGLMSFLL